VGDKVKENILQQFRELQDDEKAKQVAGYMKTSDLRFLGVKLPELRDIVKRSIRGVPTDELIPIMKELWNEPIFECRRGAIDILTEYAKKGEIKKALEIGSNFIDDIDTWALLDPLGSPALGILLRRDRSIERELKKWAKSENFWRRRATIIPYLNLALKTNYQDEYASQILNALIPHLSDDEFFVAKAVGWVLRELSKRDAKVVREFIRTHEGEMSKLAIREGSKKI
jgi:3-methyladenine DNA glycosylase AlkD